MSDLPEDGAGAPAEDEELPSEIEDEPQEPELEPEPEVEPDPEVDRPRQTRQGRRDERNRERARELETQNADLVRRLAALEAQQAQPRIDPQAAAREEAAFRESLQTMLPHEAALAVAERSERRMQQQLMQAEVRGFDRSDMTEFNTLRQLNPAVDRLAPEIERMLQANRAQGDLRFGRMDIAALLVGRQVLQRGPAAARQQRRIGALRVAAQTTKPANGRGDVAAAGRTRNQDAEDEALLRSIRPSDL